MIQTVSINSIKSNPDNPRVIRDDKFKKLVKSIQEFPQMLSLRPIVVNDEMIVLGGNMRLKACKEAGLKEVPIIKASDLSEEQQREFIIKDNVGFGEWDWDMLANEWDEELLTEWGLDIPAFDTIEELEAEEDDFETPEGGIETDIVIGDLFEIGEHRLLCGDSTDSDAVAKLMDGNKADMVFTSPPYNGNTSVGFAKSNFKNSDLYINNELDNKTSEEYINFNTDVFSNIKTILSENGTVFYNINYNRNTPSEYIDIVKNGTDFFNLVETIIWEKTMAISLAGDNLTRIFEFVFLFYNGDGKPKMNKTHSSECVKNLWKINNVGANTSEHKACFPVELPKQAIKYYSKNNYLIYEPFTGSGSTMVAAHQLKRKCYGMELDPKYCQVIIDRMLKLDPSLKVLRNGKHYEKAY